MKQNALKTARNTYISKQKWLCAMVKFDFLKLTSNSSKWCENGLGISFGSRGIQYMILDHLETFSKKFSKKQNPAWEADFRIWNWILSLKTRFSRMLDALMRLPITSDEQTLVVRRTSDHYLKYLGKYFRYYVCFLKYLFFALMKQNALTCLGKWVFQAIFENSDSWELKK